MGKGRRRRRNLLETWVELAFERTTNSVLIEGWRVRGEVRLGVDFGHSEARSTLDVRILTGS